MKLRGFPGGSDGKESTCNVGDLGLIPGLGRSPGGGHSNPLQYSCLENLHEQRSLAAAVHRVAKSRTGVRGWAGTQPINNVVAVSGAQQSNPAIYMHPFSPKPPPIKATTAHCATQDVVDYSFQTEQCVHAHPRRPAYPFPAVLLPVSSLSLSFLFCQ